MKKLIFIDNHPLKSAIDSFKTFSRKLQIIGEVPKSIMDDMVLFADFSTNPDLEREAILFHPEHVIVTASLFVDAGFDSFGQLNDYLTAAGEQGLTGRVFVDTTNKLPRAFNRIIDVYSGDLFGKLSEVNRAKRNYKFMCEAINNNHIITITNNEALRLTIVRRRVKETPVNLAELFEK